VSSNREARLQKEKSHHYILKAHGYNTANGLSNDVSVIDIESDKVVATFKASDGHGKWN